MPEYCESTIVAPGSALTLTLFLHSTDTQNSHTIQSVVVLPPFLLAHLSPTVPLVIMAGGNASVSVTLHSPASNGDYYPTVDVGTF
ncbi:MAG: hypothetical protein L3K23_06940 [Thermoplasmata archaeon]|nr:hypothetical protein [Thermoplasmata archaeon]